MHGKEKYPHIRKADELSRAEIRSKIIQKKKIVQKKPKASPEISSDPTINFIMRLQRTAGNKAVEQLITSGAFKPDLVTNEINALQAKEAKQISEGMIKKKSPDIWADLMGSDSAASSEVSSGASSQVSSGVESGIRSMQGGGQSLSTGDSKYYQARMGQDFSKVRVHTGTRANALAQSINARAFTTGRDIFFGKSESHPGSRKGKKLMAHELTHVVQQGKAPAIQSKAETPEIRAKLPETAVQARLRIGSSNDIYEQEADRVAESVVNMPDSAVQRQMDTEIHSPVIQREEIQRKEEEADLSWGQKIVLWVLEKAGEPGKQISRILKKSAQALPLILKSKDTLVNFVGNLAKAIGAGFLKFKDNFAANLKAGFFEWIAGSATNIVIPKKFDAKGIFSLIVQLTGLGFENLKNILGKPFGRENVEAVSHFVEGDYAEGIANLVNEDGKDSKDGKGNKKETVTAEEINFILANGGKLFEMFTVLKNEGFGGLVDYIKEDIAELKTQIVEEVKTVVLQKVITAVTIKLISMTNPGSAIFTVVKTLWDFLQFVMGNIARFGQILEGIVGTFLSIAKGNLSSVGGMIENLLKKFVPVVIDLFAALTGVRGIIGKVQKLLKKFQEKVAGVILKMAQPLSKGVKSAFTKIRGFFSKAGSKITGRNRKNDRVKPEGPLTEKEKTKHQKYVDEIDVKLKKDKGKKDESYEAFHARKEKLAEQLEKEYQPKLKKGIYIDITPASLEKDKEDNDVDINIRIAPNNAEKDSAIKKEGELAAARIDEIIAASPAIKRKLHEDIAGMVKGNAQKNLKDKYGKDIHDKVGKKVYMEHSAEAVVNAVKKIFNKPNDKLTEDTIKKKQDEIFLEAVKEVGELFDKNVDYMKMAGKLRATHGLKRDGNIGIAEINLTKAFFKETLKSYSGNKDKEINETIPKFTGRRKFTTLKVNSKSEINGPGAYDRHVCSEAKLLEHIAAELGDDTNVKGTIILFTEDAPCPSCKGVIKEFLDEYNKTGKNITIKVVTGKL
ncbi:MAG: DUF4157 domain-containing protein [bacterium]|nr:DUF4157 domain-containing protein [bacterium]